MSKLRDFVTRDHRYVLLGTSVVAFLGMLLSSSTRPELSFLASAFTVELVMYYVLVAWLALSALALLFKLTHWHNYAETAPFTKPAVARALRVGSYVIWAITAVLLVDRWAMGLASAWQVAAAAEKMPDDMLAQVLYMFQQGRDTYITGIITTIELAVFGTLIAFFLALLLVFARIMQIDRSDNDCVRFFKKIGVEIYSVSTDTHFTHKAWHESSEAVGKVQFPMVGDPSFVLCRNFQVLIEKEGMAERGTFVINPQGKIVAMEFHDEGIGRDAAELLRKVEAAQYIEANPGQVCPARWRPGDATLTPSFDLVGKI